jgi:hypothetical protein
MKTVVSAAKVRLFYLSAGPMEVRESDQSEDEQSSLPLSSHAITCKDYFQTILNFTVILN